MDFLLAILKSEIPALNESNLESPFELLDVDSFAMVELRAAIEIATGRTMNDEIWMGLKSPSDILATCASGVPEDKAPEGLRRRREHHINMPEMAVGGLSENWLFKELGDLHWSLISDGLAMKSAEMTDGSGERLYATFTRIRVETAPLSSFPENAPLSLEGTMQRYGGGIFLSEVRGLSDDRVITARLMSSFSKRDAEDSNRSLVKGQPTIPADCPIPMLQQKPRFAAEYSEARRAGSHDEAVYTSDYGINPYHDINGVGLVYFAAYPTIVDTCELEQIGEGPAWASRASTVLRDVMYFSNADANDTLVYSLLEQVKKGNIIESRAMISNKESGLIMALVRTSKALCVG